MARLNVRRLVLAVALWCAPASASAQWILSGIWLTTSGKWLVNIAAGGMDVPFRPLILFEAYNHCRQVMTDGRPLPKDPEPAWLGYSIGKWDRNTFVVDTNGLSGKTT
jgi:hypothetical protein